MNKILIVEDEVELLNILTEQLKDNSFVVLQAKNGADGLKMSLKHHPDMILLDIVMPIMDGLTMLNELRKDSWGKKAKVILLTNLSDNEKVAEAMKYKTYDYLVKSDWNIQDVIDLVNKRLNK
jgi:two-component system response regulator ResD